MNAEATGTVEAIDAKSASTCTFWCLVVGILVLGLLFPQLGRPFTPGETGIVIAGMERLGLLQPTSWSMSTEPLAKVASAAITVVGATERSLRLFVAALLLLGAAILAHSAQKRGTTTAIVSMCLVFLPGAFSGVGIPFSATTVLLALSCVMVWPITPRGRGVPVAALALASGAAVAWLDPLAACVASLVLAAFIPTQSTRQQRLTLGLYSVTVALMAFLDPARSPQGRLGFDLGTPGGFMLGTEAIFAEGRLAVVVPFLVVLIHRWIASLALFPLTGAVSASVALCLGVPFLVPRPQDPRLELDRVVAAMLPGDTLVLSPAQDVWRIYARAGHVTRQHTTSIDPRFRDTLAETLRSLGTRRAVICERSMLPIPDCDPVSDVAAGFPMVAPKPRRN